MSEDKPPLPMNPDFLDGEPTLKGAQRAAAAKKPTRDTLQELQRFVSGRGQKGGWARTEAGRATSPEERRHFEDRASSADASAALITEARDAHLASVLASERAPKQRPNWLSLLIMGYLNEEPTLDENRIRQRLRNEPDLTFTPPDKDGKVWICRGNSEQRFSDTGLKDMISGVRTSAPRAVK